MPATTRVMLAALRQLRILVSEDNATNRHFLEAVLERLGHKAVFCDNGLQAVERLRMEDFDMVLMDLHTPQMDGFEVLSRLKRDPRTHDIGDRPRGARRVRHPHEDRAPRHGGQPHETSWPWR